MTPPGIRGSAAAGLVTVAILVLGVGVWGVRAKLAGAVVAEGRVEARAQIVQHRDGGTVTAILVRDGERVRAGDPLIRLDGAELASEAAVLRGLLTELSARAARLEAERDGAPGPRFDPGLEARAAADPAVRAVLDGQRSLFAARRATLDETVRSYGEQAAQTAHEIDGQRAQIAAVATQIALLGDELATARALLEKGLAEASRVLALRREDARLTGQRGELEAAVARNLGRIAQIEVEILGLRARQREEAETELRDVLARIAELSEEREAIETRRARLTLLAPAGGIVHDLRVHGLAAVIRPADPVLYIIPQDEALTISARIDALQIDSVRAGQPAILRFPAFNARTTPELGATVERVSADVSTDERTGAQYYTAELRAREGEIARLGGQALLPGMPVEVFVQTGERSPLGYVMKPFADYFARALRDGG